MDIIRISLLGICGVVLGFFLKGTRTEYVSFITMGIGIIILDWLWINWSIFSG